MSDLIERCPTGIEGFDKLCQGGFVRNSDNLIVGGPGSGKTTFLLQFLWNGVTKFSENGLYCSFEPDIVETLKDGMVHGWDFTKLSNEGRIKFMRFAPQTSVDELKSELTKMVSKYDIKRIAFDPISVLAMNLDDQGKIRQTIFDLSSLMKRLKVTCVFADESLEGEIGPVDREWAKTDILRFLSDSVTIFYESGIAGVGDRALRISKMRRTSHERIAVGMKIMPLGIEVIDPSLTIGDLPSLYDEEGEKIEENDQSLEDQEQKESAEEQQSQEKSISSQVEEQQQESAEEQQQESAEGQQEEELEEQQQEESTEQPQEEELQQNELPENEELSQEEPIQNAEQQSLIQAQRRKQQILAQQYLAQQQALTPEQQQYLAQQQYLQSLTPQQQQLLAQQQAQIQAQRQQQYLAQQARQRANQQAQAQAQQQYLAQQTLTPQQKKQLLAQQQALQKQYQNQYEEQEEQTKEEQKPQPVGGFRKG
jgi:KaiC/GvpD/RAD55 family RecA-like ATPase